MAKLSTYVIGFIIAAATTLVLISFVIEGAVTYGVSTTSLMNNSGGMCSANNFNNEIISLSSLFQNKTVDSGTYAPGQLNAPVGENMVTSTQSSGLITTLKMAVAPLTLTKSLITDLGCSIGLPPIIITAFEIVFAVSVLLLLAGLFYFRPI